MKAAALPIAVLDAKAARLYRLGLLGRVQSVRCPHCGAAAGYACKGRQKARTLGCHTSRHDKAKRKGLVLGRRGDIDRVRAAHAAALEGLR